MIRTFKLLIIFIFSSQILLSQNIYDARHSLRYAEYLYESENFAQATEEYERALFSFPDSIKIRNAFLKSCFKSKNYRKGANAIKLYAGGNITDLPNDITLEYIQFLLAAEQFKTIEDLLNKKINLNTQEVCHTQLSILMLKKEWKAAGEFSLKHCSNSKNEQYKTLSELSVAAAEFKFKKPLLAAGLSAIIPGTGKLYSGYNKDAFIAFSMVAVNAWQAYRGFRKEGAKSTYGWIFASLSAGFYIGNIYGGYTAAKRRNAFYNSAIKHKAEHLIFD